MNSKVDLSKKEKYAYVYVCVKEHLCVCYDGITDYFGGSLC